MAARGEDLVTACASVESEDIDDFKAAVLLPNLLLGLYRADAQARKKLHACCCSKNFETWTPTGIRDLIRESFWKIWCRDAS